MKKFLVAAFLVVMLSSPVEAIDLTAMGTFLASNEDTNFILIQGELYTIDKLPGEIIKPGTKLILKFVLNDDDRVVEIKIIDKERK